LVNWLVSWKYSTLEVQRFNVQCFNQMNQTNQTDEIDQIDETDETDETDEKCSRFNIKVKTKIAGIGTVSDNYVGSLGIPRKTASPEFGITSNFSAARPPLFGCAII